MTPVDLRYLDVFVDRHGRERCYFRYRGRRWLLPAPGSPGFAEAYEGLLKAVVEGTLKSPNNVAFIHGSLGWAITQFLASDEYRRRSRMTKANTRPIFDSLREKYGAGLLRDLSAKHVKAIRNEITKEYSTSRAKTAIGLITTIWEFIDENSDLDLGAVPTIGVSRGHKVSGEHEPWPDEVIEAFDKAAPPRLVLARKLALYTGQRRSDLIRMTWSQYDGEFIHGIVQQKTDERLIIPCHRDLREVLGIPVPLTSTIITNAYGGPYSERGITHAFYDVLKGLGISGYSIHGLRKNAGIALADCGCSPHMIAAILGHRTLRMVMLYTRRSNQKRLGIEAIKLWENATPAKPKNASGSK
jgi:integrase